MEEKVKVNEPQGLFLDRPEKFKAFVGGYGSGKTYVGCLDIMANAWAYPKITQGYFAPTYPQIRDIFYPTMDEVAFACGLNVEIKEGNKEVHIYAGKRYLTTVICRSMQIPQGIIGFKIGHALIDEADVVPHDKMKIAWRKIIARMRYQNARNSIDIVTTPEGFRFTHETFVKTLADKPELAGNYAIVHASTYDNEINLPDDYIPSLFEAYPKELIDAYLNGQFVNLTSGTVYYGYDRKAHESNETIQGKEPLFIGMDFNVQHMAATIFIQRPSGWHAVDELKDVFDTPAMCQIIKERWPENRIVVYPDATGKNRKSVDASISDIATLRAYGFEIRAKNVNPFVKDRVLATNKAFQDGRVWVNSKKCKTVADCLEQQTYDKNGEPDKKTGKDHQNDATSYPIAYEFPILKPVHKIDISF